MVGKAYVPERGDIIWLHFSPQAGREQAGHRPALVLSPKAYNKKTGLAVVCPVTTQIKGYPFEVEVSFNKKDGAILSDHVRNVDWRARKARKAAVVPAEITEDVMGKLSALLLG